MWQHLQRPGTNRSLGLFRRVQQDLSGGAVCGGSAGESYGTDLYIHQRTNLETEPGKAVKKDIMWGNSRNHTISKCPASGVCHWDFMPCDSQFTQGSWRQCAVAVINRHHYAGRRHLLTMAIMMRRMVVIMMCHDDDVIMMSVRHI